MKKFLALVLGAVITGIVVKMAIDQFVALTSPFEIWQWCVLGGAFLLGQVLLRVFFSRQLGLYLLQLIVVLALIPMIVLRGDEGVRVRKAAIKVCSGEGIPSAAGYIPSAAGYHPISLIYTFGGSSLADDQYPAGWLPKDETELQLVGCLNENWLTVETCQYSGDLSTIRQQHQVIVTVKAAQSGQLVKTIVVNGDLPPICSSTAQFKPGTTRTFIGGNAVSLQSIFEQLTPLVIP